MTDFSKRSEMEEYFKNHIKTLEGIKIRGVFSIYPSNYDYTQVGHRCYSSESGVCIMFENKMCFVISYGFINRMKVEFRELTEKEWIVYSNVYDQEKSIDFFNSIDDVYDGKGQSIVSREICSLEYGELTRVEADVVKGKYNTWEEELEATEETFCEVRFVMSNKKSFSICPDSPVVDGCVLVWSNDSNEVIISN